MLTKTGGHHAPYTRKSNTLRKASGCPIRDSYINKEHTCHSSKRQVTEMRFSAESHQNSKGQQHKDRR